MLCVLCAVHLLSHSVRLKLELSLQQFDGTCCKAPALKALWIIHALPVTDCMTAASTGITRLISTGILSSVNARMRLTEDGAASELSASLLASCSAEVPV